VAKPLVIQFHGKEFPFTLTKIDRTKLYGYKEAEVLDEDDRRCELATLADDGKTVVGRGGIGLGYISADGEWCDKSKLKPVNIEGEEITPVASSFAAPVVLDETTTFDEYLSHSIRLVYSLSSEENASEFTSVLKDGTIYKFPYSFRGGLEADAAFVLMGEDENIYMAVGKPTQVEFIGLQQVAAFFDEEGKADETDLMDFDMV